MEMCSFHEKKEDYTPLLSKFFSNFAVKNVERWFSLAGGFVALFHCRGSYTLYL